MVNRIIKIWLIVFTVALLALLVAIPLVGKNYVPRIVNGEGLANEITESVISVEQGFYNSHLPLFATHIRALRGAK